MTPAVQAKVWKQARQHQGQPRKPVPPLECPLHGRPTRTLANEFRITQDLNHTDRSDIWATIILILCMSAEFIVSCMNPPSQSFGVVLAKKSEVKRPSAYTVVSATRKR
jgi:hypothetical protein